MLSYVYFWTSVDKLSQSTYRTQADTQRNSTNLLTTVSVAVAPGKAAMAALKRTTMEDSFMMIVGVVAMLCRTIGVDAL